jgi:hypothetical protein
LKRISADIVANQELVELQIERRHVHADPEEVRRDFIDSGHGVVLLVGERPNGVTDGTPIRRSSYCRLLCYTIVPAAASKRW